MLDDSLLETERLKELDMRPEVYTIAQSMILGLLIASVAIGVGPVYGAMVALGGAVATLIAGATIADGSEQPLVRIRLLSRNRRMRLKAAREDQANERSRA